jgi:hypothetical protein|tara:strand:- start:297 stop:545 length:249 start_codon:yes stop_codon:yes gene_type:complete
MLLEVRMKINIVIFKKFGSKAIKYLILLLLSAMVRMHLRIRRGIPSSIWFPTSSSASTSQLTTPSSQLSSISLPGSTTQISI